MRIFYDFSELFISNHIYDILIIAGDNPLQLSLYCLFNVLTLTILLFSPLFYLSAIPLSSKHHSLSIFP